MADISKITLPSGDIYDIKDAVARASIPTKVSDIENDSMFVNAEFDGTALIISTTSPTVSIAEGVSF